MSDDDPGDNSDSNVRSFFNRLNMYIDSDCDDYFRAENVYTDAKSRGALDGGSALNKYLLHLGPVGIDTIVMLRDVMSKDLDRGGCKTRLEITVLGKGDPRGDIKDMLYKWKEDYKRCERTIEGRI